MAVAYLGNSIYTGVSGDTKPTGTTVSSGALFFETNTGIVSYYNGTIWASSSTGGGGAPTTAHYVTLFTDSTLTNERTIQAGDGVTMTDAGAGGILAFEADHRLISRLGSLAVSNTITETDILNYTIPANTLQGSGVGLINRAIRIRLVGQILYNTGAATGNFVLRVRLGGTIIYSDTTISFSSSANLRALDIDLLLFGDGDANAQGLGGTIRIGDTGSASTGYGNLGGDEIDAHAIVIGTNPAKDPAVDQILRITVGMNEANANFSVTRRYSSIVREV